MTTEQKSVKGRTKKIHEQSVVIDALGGFGLPNAEKNISDIMSGGINAATVTLGSHYGMDFAIDKFKRYYAIIEMTRDRLMMVEESQDILKAKQKGKLGIIFGFQNASLLEENVTLLSVFYRLGLRIIQLTYNEANALGCGCLEPTDTGLTSFGTQVVWAMNRLGILVDLSHTGYRTSRDAIEVSEDPVAFTHASPGGLKDIPRNRPDELIRLLAEKGGVMGVSPYAFFCKSAPGKRPTLEDFLDQIDYVVQLVGVDHVGIGTDMFTGRTKEEHFLESSNRFPKEWRDPFDKRHVQGFSSISDFPRITEGLLSRGYSDEDCGKIIGDNFHSLFQRVWKNPGF
jgi:membrane dipeptidase